MPDSKQFNLTDYLLLANPFYGDAIWAAKRKLFGQNDFTQALDYAIQGDSSVASKLAPLAATAAVLSQGHKLPGMLPGSKFRKMTSNFIGRSGNSVLGRKLKSGLLAIPAALLTQSIVSGEKTRRALQDKTASLASVNNEEEARKRMSNANMWAGIGAGVVPQVGSHLYFNKFIPKLYSGVETPLDSKQQAVLDRFIRSKNFHVHDFEDALKKSEGFGQAKYMFNNPVFNPFQGPSYAPNQEGIFGNLLRKLVGSNLPGGKAQLKKVKGFINMPDSFFGERPESLRPGILAHEVGHGVGPKAYLKGNVRSLSMLLPGLNLGQVLLAKDEEQGRMGAMVSPLTAAPLLGSEIDASVRGSKLLSKLTKGKLSLLQKLSPFVGLPTYAAFAFSPALAHAIKKNLGGYKDKK